MTSLQKAGRFLLAAALVLIPFNNLPFFHGLREIGNEGAFYPLALLLAVSAAAWALGGPWRMPRHASGKVLGLFLAWVLLSGLLNLPDILPADFKGRTGTERLVLQSAVLGFGCLSALAAFNVLASDPGPVSFVRKFAFASFAVAGLFSLHEIPILLGGAAWAVDLQTLVAPFIRRNDVVLLERVRSVSGEPSWFAMYLAFAWPWVASFFFTERRWRGWFLGAALYGVFLTLLTYSRTGYVAVAAEALLLLAGLWRAGPRTVPRRRLLVFAAGLLLTVTLHHFFLEKYRVAAMFSNRGNIYKESNTVRLGSVMTALSLFSESPVAGAGLGQYGFHVPRLAPDWARGYAEFRVWTDPGARSGWPPVHNVYARLLCELGLPGLVLWLVLWGSVLWGCWRRFSESGRETGCREVPGLALIASLSGVLLTGLSHDSFRNFGYWLVLGAAWAYVERSPAAAVQAGVPHGLNGFSERAAGASSGKNP